MKSGITRRWLRGSLLITVLIVLAAEAMFLYNYSRSYYNSVQQTMYRRFSSVSGQLKMYTGDTVQNAAASRSLALRRMVEQFADKEKYEFMLLDSYGGVIATSSGTDAGGIVSDADFDQAQQSPDGLGMAIYRTGSGELVMSACTLVPYAAEDVAALRLVTSLTLVAKQIKNVLVISLVVVAMILCFSVMSGLFFVRGIVVPLGQVERTAASIARGELDVRLPGKGDPLDEVDRLRGTINQMAEGLEETEKMKNEFISSVSHELRTPLTSIRGWMETLRTLDDPTDENYRKGLEIINNETGRLYNMVEELLDFSRLQNGRIRMECCPLDLVADPERFSEFLGLASTLVIGVEFVNMLSNHSMGAVIEIMLLAIARQMIVEHSSPLENLVAVLSIGVLYLIRKYMYIPKLDRVRHRFLADLLGWKWAQEKMQEQEAAREPDDGIWHPLNDAVDK